MEKYIIYGGDGWIGKKIISEFVSRGKTITISHIRVDNTNQLEKELIVQKPSHIICCIGRTHGTYNGEYIPTIDYLEKPGMLKDNIRDNLFSPLTLAILCERYNIHLTYMGTGCIFTYEDDKLSFSEEDVPNFFGSSYSTVKGYTDRLMHMFKNVLNIRIRMPISSDTSSRNFIMKLIRYKKICSIQNSMTVLDDLIPVMCTMCIEKRGGTINLTNPGTIEHKEILDMYTEIIDHTFEYDLFSYEEQMKVIACDRSNNELISSVPKVKNIHDSVRDVMLKLKDNLNKQRST